jgi:hypothetical protein
MLECAHLTIDSITIVTQPYIEGTPEHLDLDEEKNPGNKSIANQG